MEKDRRGKLLVTVYAVLLALTIVLVVGLSMPKKAETRKIGFVSAGSVEDAGWTAMNFQGVSEACQNLGVELLIREQVPEYTGACPQAVAELAEEGAEMIFLSSSAYSKEMADKFSDYPQISFYGIYAHYDASNITGYSTRLYQARYLSGIIAGMETLNNKIGFVAAAQTPEVYRGIDAFALGVRRVNPEAEVIVAWSGAWDDAELETRAAEALIYQEGVDVITYHQDRDNVIDAAEAAGIMSIGAYQESEGVSDNYLTCAACDWTMLYEELLREYMRGQSTNMVNDWLGLESGAVMLTACSPRVSLAALEEVEKAKEEILSGADVFTGEIYDNQGVLRCGDGEAMSDETLTEKIDWLAEGVRVYE